jgi:predicted CxxxxCH...CXXCH cytochrome family protein
LPGVGTNCAVCHTGSSAPTHNDGWVDLAIAATYNAKTGAAAENPNGTPSCVTVSCHGGQTTPDWGTGTINVDTQCISCHARGTTQYNSYNSGEHGKSDHTRQACTACHNTTKLASTHFNRLDTPTMEGPVSGTIGGGTTRVNSYNASTQTCTTSCHGSERW